LIVGEWSAKLLRLTSQNAVLFIGLAFDCALLSNGRGARLALSSASKKLTAYSLGTLMVVAVVSWCGFISWGLISLAQWLLGRIDLFGRLGAGPKGASGTAPAKAMPPPRPTTFPAITRRS
jgi:hypothetical protein